MSDRTTSDPPTVARLVVDGCDVAPLEVARTARARSRGLLGRDHLDGAIWLEPAVHVHGIGMRIDLDTAHVDRRGVVLSVQRLRRNRLGRPVWRARAVVEAAAGAFEAWGLVEGSRLDVP